MATKYSKSSIVDQITGLITKTNDKNPFIIVFVAVGVILSIYYVIFLQGKLKELSELSTTITTSRQALDVTKNDIQRLAHYQDEVKNLNSKLDNLAKKIKSRDEIPNALQGLSQVATKSGVKIEQLMPDTNRNKVLLKTKEGKFIAVPIIIGARSTYHNFGRFLNTIEKQGVFSGVADFGVMTNPDDSNQHLVKIVLNVVIYEEEKEEKPAPKK